MPRDRNEMEKETGYVSRIIKRIQILVARRR